ncbi:4-hydroxyproline epimerase [uncultured Castellaniella sp.]|uniref:4-hydroxyproline epimerase n=1 Tax=uncultured Castellaniella sp. TaxID=647907 RepID=UPI002614D479|nr:4-hydroxyproline epimerase [uncultured Castellaniella sp.]
MKRISILDSHTGGEPTRLVLDGFPDPGPGDMAQRRARLAAQHDDWRKAVILEPRGHDVLVGALLCPPQDPQAAAGVIFFNNTGYLGMCGHGTIGLIVSLAYLGRIRPGTHRVETPVGTVEADLHADGSVSVRNVPAYRHRKDVTVDVPGMGPVTGDIAWGGNWFFLVHAPDKVRPGADTRLLTEQAAAISDALESQGIRGRDGALIDHIELFGHDPEADSRSFVLCPGKAYDRSPCGTGTSAKVACLAADGKLQPGQIWHQASIIGSRFQASYEPGPDGTVIPTIRGQAHISGETTLILQDDDPFAWGITA